MSQSSTARDAQEQELCLRGCVLLRGYSCELHSPPGEVQHSQEDFFTRERFRKNSTTAILPHARVLVLFVRRTIYITIMMIIIMTNMIIMIMIMI